MTDSYYDDDFYLAADNDEENKEIRVNDTVKDCSEYINCEKNSIHNESVERDIDTTTHYEACAMKANTNEMSCLNSKTNDEVIPLTIALSTQEEKQTDGRNHSFLSITHVENGVYTDSSSHSPVKRMQLSPRRGKSNSKAKKQAGVPFSSTVEAISPVANVTSTSGDSQPRTSWPSQLNLSPRRRRSAERKSNEGETKSEIRSGDTEDNNEISPLHIPFDGESMQTSVRLPAVLKAQQIGRPGTPKDLSPRRGKSGQRRFKGKPLDTVIDSPISAMVSRKSIGADSAFISNNVVSHTMFSSNKSDTSLAKSETESNRRNSVPIEVNPDMHTVAALMSSQMPSSESVCDENIQRQSVSQEIENNRKISDNESNSAIKDENEEILSQQPILSDAKANLITSDILYVVGEPVVEENIIFGPISSVLVTERENDSSCSGNDGMAVMAGSGESTEETDRIADMLLGNSILSAPVPSDKPHGDMDRDSGDADLINAYDEDFEMSYGDDFYNTPEISEERPETKSELKINIDSITDFDKKEVNDTTSTCTPEHSKNTLKSSSIITPNLKSPPSTMIRQRSGMKMLLTNIELDTPDNHHTISSFVTNIHSNTINHIKSPGISSITHDIDKELQLIQEDENITENDYENDFDSIPSSRSDTQPVKTNEHHISANLLLNNKSKTKTFSKHIIESNDTSYDNEYNDNDGGSYGYDFDDGEHERDHKVEGNENYQRRASRLLSFDKLPHPDNFQELRILFEAEEENVLAKAMDAPSNRLIHNIWHEYEDGASEMEHSCSTSDLESVM
eukprot:CAMPEP_0182434904 /NCGR_PEP_ID=MMETSP1167-20130531/72483_1 /TAXON_ID=2988 /ORGANISM="Mallomonas Sp, Strain CCMP3275" /LENGTH=794 /DNA_ID=CAMNT_0024625301 /DNA_START=41 /DNA_END=2425 /DNA_ORIENTATION=-